ncbi:MAG: polysaccharide deacetylase family protein [Planctomycetota bacterium]|jgi:peptidoglycan/xylan/chitin deacetylase (PgdA/CDA1 family)
MSTTDPLAVVHVDLDGASAIHAAHGWPYPHEEDPLFETGLRNTLAFLEGAQVKATLFVIAQDLDNDKKRPLLDMAVSQGHEIASHSYTHRKLTTLARGDQVREVAGSREKIAETLGVPVDGFRAPYFDIDGSVLELVAEAGYSYDASCFPRQRVAFMGQEVVTQPHPFNWPGSNLTEIPMPAHRPLPFPFHASYGLVLGSWYFRRGLRRFRKTAAPLVWLLHLTDLADPMPTSMLRGLQTKFFTLSHMAGRKKRARCQDMLETITKAYRLVDSRTLAATITERDI